MTNRFKCDICRIRKVKVSNIRRFCIYVQGSCTRSAIKTGQVVLHVLSKTDLAAIETHRRRSFKVSILQISTKLWPQLAEYAVD